MSGLDAAIGTLVQDLLSGLGQTSGVNLVASCTLNVVNRNYDPLSGSAPAAANKTYSLDCTPPGPSQQTQVKGTSIEQGDFMVWVSAAQLTSLGGPTPTPENMTLTFGGKDHKIVGVESVYVGNLAVLHGIHCRE